jgi:beta-phosphoglucomutase-like phosphatase (HAD superfamily)
MAIEDSNTGAKSAEAAGCTVLVVPNQVERTNSNGSKAFREAMLEDVLHHPKAKYFNV